MKQRIQTGVLLGLIIIPILIFGHHYYIFDIFCFILSIAAGIELVKLFRHYNHLPKVVEIITVASTAGFYVLVLITTRYNVQARWLLAGLFVLILINAFFLVVVDSFKANDFGNQLLTVFYGSLGFAAFAFLRHTSLHLMIYLLMTAMVTDTFAYFFGVRFGKHKLAPKVSPKKSMEGAIAGLIFGGGISALYAILLPVFRVEVPIWAIFLISFFLSFVAQLGDLVASKLKRSFNAKDFSNLFPGHGGVLDRFDSSLFAALYLLMILGFLQGFGL